MAHQHKNRKTFTRWAMTIVAVLLVALIGYMALRIWLPGNQEATDEITVTYSAEEQAVILQLPYTLEGLPIAGSVTLRHPSDSGHDLKLRLKPDWNMRQKVMVAGLEKGHWRVSLFFTAGEESYFSEKAILIE
ncbi:FixH family protein [Pontibacter sp. 172403-2]|uniref:FixH family protein n=1 Tax=Pontibacter rufus TaxID=2791028 RepID=UPI0018AF986B|nr:FixH family protein [Pontibacter sp. 172403-2]MBF9255554.1 FixH family protein [Pontibacter sp. 172403-2]